MIIELLAIVAVTQQLIFLKQLLPVLLQMLVRLDQLVVLLLKKP